MKRYRKLFKEITSPDMDKISSIFMEMEGVLKVLQPRWGRRSPYAYANDLKNDPEDSSRVLDEYAIKLNEWCKEAKSNIDKYQQLLSSLEEYSNIPQGYIHANDDT